jgi:hypothetical protein
LLDQPLTGLSRHFERYRPKAPATCSFVSAASFPSHFLAAAPVDSVKLEELGSFVDGGAKKHGTVVLRFLLQ